MFEGSVGGGGDSSQKSTSTNPVINQWGMTMGKKNQQKTREKKSYATSGGDALNLGGRGGLIENGHNDKKTQTNHLKKKPMYTHYKKMENNHILKPGPSWESVELLKLK